MREFYEHVLGLTVVPGGQEDGYVQLQAGPVIVALHAIPEPLAASISIDSPPTPREGTPIKIVFLVSTLEAERTRLVQRGATMFATTAWGTCDGVDPEGNVFQVARG